MNAQMLRLAAAGVTSVAAVVGEYLYLTRPPPPKTVLELGFEAVRSWDRRYVAAALFGFAGCAAVARKVRAKPLRYSPISQESVQPDSVEKEQSVADCQVFIGYGRGDVIDIIGSGFRMMVGPFDCLVSTSHNLVIGNDLWLVKGDKRFHVGGFDKIQLCPDASLVVLSSQPFSYLGVKVANATPLSTTSGAVVSVTGIMGKGTTGRLRVVPHSEGCLGSTKYAGTTGGGYSGAPYVSGSSVMGMHVHGGIYNGGYELLYLYACAKCELQVEEESGEAYIMRMLRSDTDYRVQYKGQKAIVREHGNAHYHVFDRKLFTDLESRYELGIEDENASHPVSVSAPVVSESGPSAVCLNYQGPGVMSRAGSCTPCCPHAQQPTSSMCQTRECAQPLSKDLKPQASQSSKPGNESSSSDLPTPDPQPSGSPSTSSPSSGRKMSRRMKSRRID